MTTEHPSSPSESEKPDFEKMIERQAYKSHPLGFNDSISVTNAEDLLETFWNDYVIPARKRIEELAKENELLNKLMLSGEIRGIAKATEESKSRIAELEAENKRLKEDVDALHKGALANIKKHLKS
jgi:hypothetical protein